MIPWLGTIVAAFALISASTFVEWRLFGDCQQRFLLLELGLVLVLLWTGWRRRTSLAPGPWPVAPMLATALAAGLALAVFVQRARSLPAGDYDAVAIWNLRARFFWLAPERLGEVLDGLPAMPHADYPLHTSLLVARIWGWVGSDHAWVPLLVGASYLALTVLIVAGALAMRRGRGLALAGATLILGTAGFVRHAADQYADTPLACCIALAVAAHVCGLPLLAGAAAGAAAWTKNEGQLFCACMLVATWRWRTLAGALPLLAVVLVFKLRVRIGNELLPAGRSDQVLQLLLDPERHGIVAWRFFTELLRCGRGLAPLLLGVVLWLRRSLPHTDVRASRRMLVVLGLTALGELAVALITPYDLRFHLRSTQGRLLLQLWPALVICLLLELRDPWLRKDPAQGGVGTIAPTPLQREPT